MALRDHLAGDRKDVDDVEQPAGPAIPGRRHADRLRARPGSPFFPCPTRRRSPTGGARPEGPAAILRASAQLELYDEQLDREPFRCGIWTDPLLELPAGDGEEAAAAVAAAVRTADGRRKVGRDAGWRALDHPGRGPRGGRAGRGPAVVVQLDAHADLRESYEGDRWSHACAMARCLEIAPVHAIGVRSYSAEERERIRAGIPGYRFDARLGDAGRGLDRDRPSRNCAAGRSTSRVDVDYFDPAVIPATGTPEPGGGQWWPTLLFLRELFSRASVVACDVVELAPVPGLHHADFTVARLVHKLIGFACGTSFPAAPPRVADGRA